MIGNTSPSRTSTYKEWERRGWLDTLTEIGICHNCANPIIAPWMYKEGMVRFGDYCVECGEERAKKEREGLAKLWGKK